MFKTYDEYLEAHRPKYIETCPHCKKEYFSFDGDEWGDDDGERYTRCPVNGSSCISCETDRALTDPEHWAAQEVLCKEEALLWVIKDAIRYSGDERQQMIVRLFKLLEADEDFAESMRSYLDEHYTDVYEAVEYEF